MGYIFEEIDDSGCPCVASGIGGVIVPESFTVTEVCQDPDNLNIIYFKITLKGIYDYTPSVKATYIDSNNNLKTVDISSRLIYNYKSIGISQLPISTNCGSVDIIIAYDVASSILNFQTLASIDFTITMLGEVNQLFSPLIQSTNIFISSNPTVTTTFNKGVTPKPYKIYYDENTNQLKVQYTNLGTTPCMCAINCVSPSEEDFGLTICNNEIQEVNINGNTIIGDPTEATITFLDAVGNQTNINIHAMTNVIPMKLQLLEYDDPVRAHIYLHYNSVNFIQLDKTKIEYQIWKYKDNVDNAYIWKDWSNKTWSTFYDTDIINSSSYGYAVRFRGEFGEISNFSDWTIRPAK